VYKDKQKAERNYNAFYPQFVRGAATRDAYGRPEAACGMDCMIANRKNKVQRRISDRTWKRKVTLFRKKNIVQNL
jgi:hypothetical protein